MVPPVAPVSRYIGHPKTRWNTALTKANGASPIASFIPKLAAPLASACWYGTCVSPSVVWFVLEWWMACERCQEKYGTSSTECSA